MMTDKKKGRPRGEKPPKKLRTIKLDQDFERQLIRAAYWARTTVNAIIEEGAALVLQRLEAQHNQGKPFKPTPNEDE